MTIVVRHASCRPLAWLIFDVRQKPMPITTRFATFGDVQLLVGMMREFYAEANYALDVGWAATAFTTLLKGDSRGAIWIASEKDDPVGYVVFTFRFSMEFGGADAFIDDLFVRPKYRRRGAGRAMLAAAFDEIRLRGMLAVHVETGYENVAAKALYGSFGLQDRKRLLLTARLTSRGESPLNDQTA
jgi:GNAT superfamily N-acetyltransferase